MSAPYAGSGASSRSQEAHSHPSTAAVHRHAGARGELIAQSHARCAALGLSRIARPDYDPFGRADLSVARERNRQLLVHAAPVMELLFNQISGTGSMVVLCDAAGTIIHSIGDDDFLAKASKVALQPGVNWAEQSKGTNAIGTALMEERSTLVHAEEHYLHANHFLTCSATPILDPRGNVMGVLDVTGDHRSYHQHTMGLVNISARMIENRWLSSDFSGSIALHFHARVEFIGTLMEGILVLKPDGRIVAANRSALEQLGLSGASLRANTIPSLFGLTVQAMIDRFRSEASQPILVRSPDGKSFHLTGRVEPSMQRLLPTRREGYPSSAVISPTRTYRQPMARLRSGDSQVEAQLDKLQHFIDRRVPLLIVGETGTGKEALARAIHLESKRHQLPFATVNCAGMTEAALEAQLFGPHPRTGARALGDGAVARVLTAGGGTIFFDDVDELTLPCQARLLRFLRERETTPHAGHDCSEIRLSVICGTRADLRECVATKRFREDLLHQINAVVASLPPLRERSDLESLARQILAEEAPGALMELSTEAMSLLKAHPWPGNLRQLRNILRTAAVMAEAANLIGREHLPLDFIDESTPAAGNSSAGAAAAGRALSAYPRKNSTVTQHPALSLQEVELQTVRRTLRECGGNISEASKRLGVSRNTVYRKLHWNKSSSA